MKILFGFMFLVGTVGAYELGNIGTLQLIIQSAIALAILYKNTKERSDEEC